MTHEHGPQYITATVGGTNNNAIIGSAGSKIESYSSINANQENELREQLKILLSKQVPFSIELAKPENAAIKKAIENVESETAKPQPNWKTVLESCNTVGSVAHLFVLSAGLLEWAGSLASWATAVMP